MSPEAFPFPQNIDEVAEEHTTLIEQLLAHTYYRQEFSAYLGESVILFLLGSMIQNNELFSLSMAATATCFIISAIALLDELSSFGKKLRVGQYVNVRKGRYRSFQARELQDGTVLYPGDKLGVIDLSPNINRLNKSDTSTALTRKVLLSIPNTLTELAILCEKDDPFLREVKAFFGESHVAELADKFGFEVSRVKHPTRKIYLHLNARVIAQYISGQSEAWKKQKHRYTPYAAFMSKDELTDKYLE